MTGAADVPLQCINWSRELHLCVSASALAHTDQGRISELVVCGRPRVEGEECSDESRSEAVRAFFGGDVTRRLQGPSAGPYYAPQQQQLQSQNSGRPSAAAAAGQDDDDQQRRQAALAGSPLPSVARARFTAAMSRIGGLRAVALAAHPRERLVREPNLDLAQDPSHKMAQIVGFWREVVSTAPPSSTAAAPPAAPAPSNRAGGDGNDDDARVPAAAVPRRYGTVREL
jgi:hypothetical protein